MTLGCGCCETQRKKTVAEQHARGDIMEGYENIEVEGDCSWCLETTTHSIQKRLALRRQAWVCGKCRGRTIPCKKCGCMARFMTNHQLKGDCAKCRGTWTLALRRRADVFERPRRLPQIREDLQRESEAKAHATHAGMLRPFLLLASMSPDVRSRIAVNLGWGMLQEPHFGNAHEEAWQLLNRSMKGLQARVNLSRGNINPFDRKVNWFQCIHAISEALFKVATYKDIGAKASLEVSCSVGSRMVAELEADFIDKLALLQRSRMSSAQVSGIARVMANEGIQRLMAGLSELLGQRGSERKGFGQYAVDTVYITLCQASDPGFLPDAEQVMEQVLGLFRETVDESSESGSTSLSPSKDGGAGWNPLEPLNKLADVNIELRDEPGHGISFVDIAWVTVNALQIPQYSNLARMVVCLLLMLLQNVRLKVNALSIDHMA